MAEACTLSHAESRRSLPAWMLKACSGNEVVKTEDRDAKASESDEQSRDLDQTKPIKRNTGRQLKNVDPEGAGELGVLWRREGREKGRKKSKNAVEDEIEEIEEAASKNSRKVSARAAPKSSRKRKLENVKSEASSPGTIDDEIELTVEDLVSIAEEYVNADKQKEHELETVNTARRKQHLPSPTISTEVDTGGTIVSGRSMKGLLQCTTVTTNTRPSEHRRDENERHQEVQWSSSVETTGDVAQDMLNLFLGPLLSKPASYTEKSEYIESITANANCLPEKKNLPSEVPRQGEPVTKKKSSLKDKVALFF